MSQTQPVNVDVEKARLGGLLDDALLATMAAVQQVKDTSRILYERDQWHPKDVIAHIAAYDREIITSLKAYRDGSEYAIPVSGDEFNALEHQKSKDLAPSEVYRQWAEIRARFKAAISAMPAAKFEGHLLFPWGSRGSITFLVEDTIAHEADHRKDLLKAASG